MRHFHSPRQWYCLLSGCLALPVLAEPAALPALLSAGNDPFATTRQQPPRLLLHPGDMARATTITPCPDNTALPNPLGLADVVQHALCHHPQTREVWANARAQVAQLGVAQAAYLPNLGATLSGSQGRSNSSGTTKDTRQASTRADLSWLLYDFGARGAALDNARALLAASIATQASTVQALFLTAVQAYHQVQASQSALAAARESERASETSFRAAEARFRAGTNTRADQLQAQTAWSQATLARIQAEGALKTAQGNLALIIGRDADTPLPLAPPPDLPPLAVREQAQTQIRTLIDAARQQRPDLLAAEAQLQAAQAAVAQASAAGYPTLTLAASTSQTRTTGNETVNTSSLGVNLVVPLFTGFSIHYKIRAAEALLESKTASRDRIRLQVAQDVWKARHDLDTASQSLKTAASLLDSARESERMALGRYQAGVGTLLDLLTAQSAHATARQQQVRAQYDWHVARATLAQALGTLDFNFLPALTGDTPRPPAISGTRQP